MPESIWIRTAESQTNTLILFAAHFRKLESWFSHGRGLPFTPASRVLGTGELLLFQGLQPPGTSLAEDNPPVDLEEDDPCSSFVSEALSKEPSRTFSDQEIT